MLAVGCCRGLRTSVAVRSFAGSVAWVTVCAVEHVGESNTNGQCPSAVQPFSSYTTGWRKMGTLGYARMPSSTE